LSLGLYSPRFSVQSGSTTSRGGPSQIPSLIGAAGGLTGGIGAMMLASSKDFKEDISLVDKTEQQRVLDEIKGMPMFEWKYKPEFGDDKKHIGLITEFAPERFVTGGGKALDPINAIGSLTVAVKGLAEKLEEIEEKFDAAS
jgi:hypothetical protein